MRSQGRVRFIKISSRVQAAGAGVVAVMLLVWLATVAGVAISRLAAGHEQSALLTREARVERSENRLAAYARGITGVADDLKRRQDFIDRMVQAHLGDLPGDPHADETARNPGKSAWRYPKPRRWPASRRANSASSNGSLAMPSAAQPAMRPG